MPFYKNKGFKKMKLYYLSFSLALLSNGLVEGMFQTTKVAQKAAKVERFTATFVNNTGERLSLIFIVARDARSKTAEPVFIHINNGERIPVPLTRDSNLHKNMNPDSVYSEVKKGNIQEDAIYRIEYFHGKTIRAIDLQGLQKIFDTLDACPSKNVEIEFGSKQSPAPFTVKCLS